MSPETEEHKRIKEIVSDFLRMQYNSTLNEYPDSGNISDVMAVTNDRISIFVENVWTSSKSNFQRDLNILHRSTAEVKIFIVNSKILQDGPLRREFEKTRMTERKKGFQVSEMIDGSKVLNQPDYVAKEFSKIVKELVTEARKMKSEPRIMKRNNQSQLKHSKRILLTRADYQGLDYWDEDMMIENLLLHGNDELETKSVMQHFETGYNNGVWSPLMEYKDLMDKYNYPTVPAPKRFNVASSIESGIFEEFERIPSNDRKRLQELNRQLIQKIKRIIFEVENGIPLKGQCDFCP